MKKLMRKLSETAFTAVMLVAALPQAQAQDQAKAILAGGCFWCLEAALDQVPGVISTTSGYTGGTMANPKYKDISTGKTGHTEAVEVVYDPSKVSFEKILEAFWRNIDPTVTDRQFCDVGSPYRAEIFYLDDAQKRIAEATKAALATSKPFKEPVVTPITRATQFYVAEEEHQDYYKKEPKKYKKYHGECKRDERLVELWGKLYQ
jgi:peptide-methionine (S)-S-oxide reductase